MGQQQFHQSIGKDPKTSNKNNSSRAHTDPLFKQSNILKIKDLYKFNIALLAFDYKHGLLPTSSSGFYEDRNNFRPTRQSYNIQSKIPRTNFLSLSVYHMIPEIWNDLPNNIKTSNSRSTFKKSIKNRLTNTYELVVQCDDLLCVECYPNGP